MQDNEGAKMAKRAKLTFLHFCYAALISIFFECLLFKPNERLHYNFCQNLYLQVSSLEYVLILVQKGDFQKTQLKGLIFLLSCDCPSL